MNSTSLTASIAISLILGLEDPALAQSDLYQITEAKSATVSKFHNISIPKGGEHVLANLDGPGKVTYFYITDDTVGRWYPGLVLKVYWDGSEEPAINVPLADFFGAIGGVPVDFSSAAIQVNQACFMCYLPMPFSKQARFVLANDGDREYAQKVAYGIDYEKDQALSSETSRLYSRWQRSNPVTGGLHRILDTSGRGHYVGSILQVVSKDHGVWFGEGDTNFLIDGEKIIHSPGSEDEYGSCWANSSWSTYDTPYCGHPLNRDGVNRMYRWYFANPVRFQKGLQVEIQNQHDNGTPTDGDADDYTSVAFWYQQGPASTPALPPFDVRTKPSFETKNPPTSNL